MRIATIASLFAGALFVAACGQTTEEQAATGAVGGLAVAGPVGAAAGGLAGAAVGDEVPTPAN
jgi:osmotically inducible lipoprotein OsmB